VQTIVGLIAEFGIAYVDVPTRLEVLNKTLHNAGNNYYRAWMENVSAMDITREWLKAASSSSAEGQVLETTMPTLTVSDSHATAPFLIRSCTENASWHD
jgi:protein phosphatase 1 regulatory subunit 10